MALFTLSTAKALLSISDTSRDTLITTLIPLVEAKVRTYCNASFTDENGEDDWPSGIELDAIHVLKFHLEKVGKLETSESLPGGYSAQYKSEAEVMKPLNRYRRLYP